MNVFSLKILIHLLLLRPFVHLLFGVNIEGKENIPDQKNYILISNHNSHFDILLLFYLLPLRHIKKTHPVAAKEYFSKNRIVFLLVNYLFSPVWVSRGKIKENKGFMDELRENLDAGQNLIIFPEGTRGTPGEMQSFKSCIGKVSEEYSEIPIIPVFLLGPERSLPRKSAIPVPLWNHVTIHEPRVFNEAAKVITHSLEKTIREFVRKENAVRHKRKLKKNERIKSIAVLGIDGSGKSTLARNIALRASDESKITLLSDKLQFYSNGKIEKLLPFFMEYIRRFVSSYAKKARSLKFYKIPKLTELILRNALIAKVKRWHDPHFLVLDGSPVLNLTAWSALYKEELFNEDVCKKAINILCSQGEAVASDDPIFSDFSELKKLKKFRLTNFYLPEIVIFLDVSPQIAIERINKRGEKKQVHEKEDKLARLRNAYLRLCEVLEVQFEIPTMVISGDNSIAKTTDMAIDFINIHLKEEIDHEKPAN